MPHFAEIKDGIVQRVIVADQEFIDSGAVGDPSTWVMSCTDENGKEPVRKNAAGAGMTLDTKLDAFVPFKEFESWTLNEATAKYEAPVEMPKNGKPNFWHEGELAWLDPSTNEVLKAVDPAKEGTVIEAPISETPIVAEPL